MNPVSFIRLRSPQTSIAANDCCLISVHIVAHSITLCSLLLQHMDIVGKTCNNDAQPGSESFCGKVSTRETVKGALVNVTEWIGICDSHVCAAPLSKRAKVCSKGQTDYLSLAPQTTAKHDKLQLATYVNISAAWAVYQELSIYFRPREANTISSK